MDGPEGWPLYLDRYAALLKGTADMAPIVTSAEIGRPAAEVFACATGPARFTGPGRIRRPALSQQTPGLLRMPGEVHCLESLQRLPEQ